MCVFRGGEASWLSEKQSDNTIQAGHSSTFCCAVQKCCGGWRGWVQSDPPIALKDSETWRWYLKLKPHCCASFYSMKGGGAWWQLSDNRTRTCTHTFPFSVFWRVGGRMGGNLTSRSWPSPSNPKQNEPLRPPQPQQQSSGFPQLFIMLKLARYASNCLSCCSSRAASCCSAQSSSLV